MAQVRCVFRSVDDCREFPKTEEVFRFYRGSRAKRRVHQLLASTPGTTVRMTRPPCRVSIILSTYNRCEMLSSALDRVVAQSSDSPSYEVIVVDNNSTDDTRRVVESFAAHRNGQMRYLFEPRQGLSYARNVGIAAADADLVAFTDDDVRVAEGWVSAIVRAFDAHPDVDCLGGRTLPIWPSSLPPWLTRLHWIGPLALQDYGERSFFIDARRPLSLAGANLAFRKRIFDRVGLFSPSFLRSEDTELLLRLWQGGGQALYVPDMLVHAAVQPERLTKTYHREWHANIGRCNARMGFEEIVDPVLGLHQPPRLRQVGGVPLFAVKQVGIELCRWLIYGLSGSRAEAFLHETRVRRLMGYIGEKRALRHSAMRPRQASDEAQDPAPLAISPRSRT
jgi:GT2 family glycosyltransferase